MIEMDRDIDLASMFPIDSIGCSIVAQTPEAALAFIDVAKICLQELAPQYPGITLDLESIDSAGFVPGNAWTVKFPLETEFEYEVFRLEQVFFERLQSKMTSLPNVELIPPPTGSLDDFEFP